MKVLLTDEEAAVVNAALRLRTVLSQFEGICYRSALFLRLFLSLEHGIEGKAIVGYVNDGNGFAFASHAWFEYNDQITDIAISRPLNPTVNPPGPLFVQGIELEPGYPYRYHYSRPPEAESLLKRAVAEAPPNFAVLLRQQEETHTTAVRAAKSIELCRNYLDAATDRWDYERMRRAVLE